MSDTMLGHISWYRRADVRSAMRTLNISEQQLFAAARAEADGAGVWSSWAPGVQSDLGGGKLPRGTANLRVDPALAISASFVPTE